MVVSFAEADADYNDVLWLDQPGTASVSEHAMNSSAAINDNLLNAQLQRHQDGCVRLHVYKVKRVRSFLWETHCWAMERHLPYGITQLPATQHGWMRPALTPASQADCNYSTTVLDLPATEGWKAELTLVLVICQDDLPVVRPSSSHLTGSRSHDLLI